MPRRIRRFGEKRRAGANPSIRNIRGQPLDDPRSPVRFAMSGGETYSARLLSAMGFAASAGMTAMRLGPGKIATVLGYRLAARRGWLDPRPPPQSPGSLFGDGIGVHRFDIADPSPIVAAADEICAGRMRALTGVPRDFGDPPDWHRQTATGASTPAGKPWWAIADFDGAIADIKGIWEISRFDWAPVLALAALQAKSRGYLDTLQKWSEDWVQRNPPYLGANWKCGQETSLRLLSVLLAARLLEQDRTPQPALISFVETHLARIAATFWYALGQDNNHGTSEAAALFVGGAWLAKHARGEGTQRKASHWSANGRRWLEKLVQRLVLRDGGFSQYSVSYHRVFLVTMCQVELWRRRLGRPSFSVAFYERCALAAAWLARIVNAANGDAPNLGSNDAANLFRLDGLALRDFRPAVQTASRLFLKQSAYPPGPWDIESNVYDLPNCPFAPQLAAKTITVFPHFGLALINPRSDGSGPYAFVRVPSAQFRPGQADPLHFDLWTEDGENVLRDGGSYSYADQDAAAYFSGIASHNTIQFDGREPMRKLSRFLYGDWIQGECDAAVAQSADGISWPARYRDAFGATHLRRIHAQGRSWRIADEISSFKDKAVLRWRLKPGDWKTQLKQISNGEVSLAIESDHAPVSLRLVKGWEARHYLTREPLPVLEAVFGPQTRRIETTIVFNT
jgi:hypothetical protein